MTIRGVHSKGAEDLNLTRQRPTTRCRRSDGLRLKNYSGKKASLIFLQPISKSIKGYLYHCSFIIQEKTCIYKKTKSHPDLCNFGWVSDNNATLSQEKMLLSVPEHYTVRSWCKSKCTKQCKSRNNDVDCTDFCKFGWVVETAIITGTLYSQMWVQIKMHQNVQV